MRDLFELIRYNNTPYKQLTNESEKDLIEKIVAKIKEEGLEKEILNLSVAYFSIGYNPSKSPTDLYYSSDLPDNLFFSLTRIHAIIKIENK